MITEDMSNGDQRNKIQIIENNIGNIFFGLNDKSIKNEGLSFNNSSSATFLNNDDFYQGDPDIDMQRISPVLQTIIDNKRSKCDRINNNKVDDEELRALNEEFICRMGYPKIPILNLNKIVDSNKKLFKKRSPMKEFQVPQSTIDDNPLDPNTGH